MKINKEDSQLFRSAVDDNAPFDKDAQPSNHTQKWGIFESYDNTTIANNLLSGDVVAYKKNGTPPRMIKRMKQGKIPHPPVLDLHGQTASEACKTLAKFIYQHQNRQFIHVIHGKGHHNENKTSVLKTQVVHFLKQHPQILAFNSCPARDGGTGALFVFLKH